jgi:hypothetical protein
MVQEVGKVAAFGGEEEGGPAAIVAEVLLTDFALHLRFLVAVVDTQKTLHQTRLPAM